LDYDCIIIGAGHNGLVCAAYLAAAGRKVLMLERRGVVGGAAVTEEFHPGFRNSVAAYTVSLLQPKVIRDLDLTRHGLRIVPRKMANFLPLLDGDFFATGPGITAGQLERFSSRDAARLPLFEARLQRIADVLRHMVLESPPNLVEDDLAGSLPELVKSLGLAARLGKLDLAAKRDLLDLFAKSAGDWLDSWFESEPIKAVLGFDSIVGNYASPYTPGSAYVLLHHAFGELFGERGVWGHAIGGMGAITQAMAACCRERGVEIQIGAGVREVLIEQGRAAGVVLESGEIFRAGAVISNLNPKLLFGHLVDPAVSPPDFSERIGRYRCASGTFRMNVALSDAPHFACRTPPADHLTAGIIIGPSLAYMDRAYMDARATGWSCEPIVELLIPSVLDASLAPPGRHVASLFCQHVAPTLPNGASWDDHKEEVADLMIRTVDQYAPGFEKLVIGRQVLSPLDLEREFGLIGGDIMHGALSLDQLFAARPVLGHADYRTPIIGLYQCGAGTHPGGGVTGAPGHNAARAVLRDFTRRRRS
jgi:phytoene dehydrogenase-like protein